MQQNTLRERKKARTRERLVEVATRLFVEKGFENTTADEIAEAAEVSRRTFFRYFPTKESVVFPGFQDRITAFRALVEELQKQHSPFETIRQALLTFSEEFTRRADELRNEWRIVSASPTLIARDIEHDFEYEKIFAEVLANGAEPGSPRDFQARVYAGAILGAMRATLDEWYMNDCEPKLFNLGERSIEVVEMGARLFHESTYAKDAPSAECTEDAGDIVSPE